MNRAAVRSTFSRLLVSSGATRLARSVVPRRGVLIFYAHRLGRDRIGFMGGIPAEWFEEQIAHLVRHYRFVSLSEVAAHFEEGRPIPDRSAVLTFDDGFRDNLTVGLPIMRKYDVPATVFVVTQSITEGCLPWPQRVGYLLENTRLETADLYGRATPLRTPSERLAAYWRIRTRFFSDARVERDALIEELGERLAVEPPRDRMLSWEDLRTMMEHRIEVGAHTYSHAWLSFISREEARSELERCRDDLEANLGVERAAFCFPGGACNQDLVTLVRDTGFRSSFLPNLPYRANTLTSSTAFSLSRIGLPTAPAYELEAGLDGPLYPARRLVRSFRADAAYSNDAKWSAQARQAQC